jgi:predicted RNA-binding protein
MAIAPALRVTGQKSALRALRHRAVVDQHKRSLRRRRRHAVAVLIPCAETKPYRESPSHSEGYCLALQDKDVDVWVVSEPMGVIPYAWSDRYPNESYEFAPKHLKGEAKQILVDRIEAWLERQGVKYDEVYLALPDHHMRLVMAAEAQMDDEDAVELIDASIGTCRELGYCPKTHYRATSSAYVDYLRRSIPG